MTKTTRKLPRNQCLREIAPFAEYLKLMHVGVPKGNQTVRQVLDAYWVWAQNNPAEETCSAVSHDIL